MCVCNICIYLYTRGIKYVYIKHAVQTPMSIALPPIVVFIWLLLVDILFANDASCDVSSRPAERLCSQNRSCIISINVASMDDIKDCCFGLAANNTPGSPMVMFNCIAMNCVWPWLS